MSLCSVAGSARYSCDSSRRLLVAVAVGVSVGVRVGLAVKVRVGVGVWVRVGFGVGVHLGGWQGVGVRFGMSDVIAEAGED